MAIADFARGKIANVDIPMDILSFTRHPDYLNIKLYPIQIFIFKLMYGISLSDDISNNPIIIKDEFNEHTLHTFTSEVDFLDFLYTEKRINSKNIEDPLETLFFLGRRGTKSTMISVITAFTLYLVLRHESPQEYFQILMQSEIGVAVVSNNKGNASKQLREIANMVYGSKWFSKFLVNKEPASEGFFLKTTTEIKDPKSGVGRILVAIFAASPSVRGSANIEVIMDEYAHYIDSDKSTKKDPLDEKVYDALVPSVSGFVDKKGKALGKVFIATSPNGKKGNSYKKYKASFGDPNTLMLHMPSHWVNPQMSTEFIRKKYEESEVVCAQEYWAEFTDAKHGYVKIEGKIKVCEDARVTNVMKGSPRIRYYAGIDQALSTDSFAVVVCHHESSYSRTLVDDDYKIYLPDKDGGVYILDYIRAFVPPEESDESLDIDEVIDEVKRVFKAFKIVKGGYDQWSKEFMQREFKRMGIMQRMELLTATQVTNSDWAKSFKRLINKGQIVWSAFTEDTNGVTFTDEVMGLEEKVSSAMIKVEASSGGHDDRFSAACKALYLCMDDISKDKKSSESTARKAIQTANKKVTHQRSGRHSGIRLS